LVYFPYTPDAKERYIRITGPLAELVADEWTPTQKIPKTCKASLVASEDSLFFDHMGIDFTSLRKALEDSQKNSLKRKHTIRGGSTITQQLVKNAFLSRKKSYLRKSREAIGALFLNLIMSKDKQLAWYFNIVEFGPRIYGIHAASQFYFKKKTEELLPHQCAALVALLPSPNKWNKSLIENRHSPFFSSRVRTILARSHQMPMRPTLPGEKPPSVMSDDTQNGISDEELDLMNDEELEDTIEENDKNPHETLSP